MKRIEIRIDEHINQEWTEWFYGLRITHLEGGGTELSGPIIDQASLYGLIARLRDLRLSLTYLRCEEEAEEEFYR